MSFEQIVVLFDDGSVGWYQVLQQYLDDIDWWMEEMCFLCVMIEYVMGCWVYDIVMCFCFWVGVDDVFVCF